MAVWTPGEHGWRDGSEFTAAELVCPWCGARGEFNNVFHEARQVQSARGGAMNFELWQCAHCARHSFVIWTGGEGKHDFVAWPEPESGQRVPESWPAAAGRAWQQAKAALDAGAWDAAATMARRAIALATREKGAQRESLAAEVDDLGRLGLLAEPLRKWGRTLKALQGPKGEQDLDAPPVGEGDARDAVRFARLALEQLYSLPATIDSYEKERRGR